MEIDLRKLYSAEKIAVNEEIIIPEDYYQNLDVINISSVNLQGEIALNYDGEIELKGELKGTFTISCAISLEEVDEPFSSEVEIIIVEKAQKNQINLALLDILWENIVLEVPMKVIKKGVKTDNIKGEGWELEEL